MAIEHAAQTCARRVGVGDLSVKNTVEELHLVHRIGMLLQHLEVGASGRVCCCE